jgi:O-antigen ligase
MIKTFFHNEKNIFSLGIVFFLATVYAMFTMQLQLLLVVPSLILLAFFIVRDIRFGFYALLLSLPISLNISEWTGVSMDFPDEPLMILLTLIFVFFSLLNSKQIDYKSVLRNPLVVLIMISFIWTFVTIFHSEQPILSLKYGLKKIWFLIPFLFLPIILFRDEKIIKQSFQFLFSILFIVVLIVTIRHANVGFSFEEVHDPLQPFFQNHVMYGSMLSCMIPLTVGAISLSRKWSIQWMFALLGLALLLFAVYVSYSRAAWMGVVFAGFAYILIRLRVMHYAFLVFYALVFSAVLWLSMHNKFLDFKPKFEKTIMHESLEDHIMATIQGTDISSAERYYRWIAAVRMSAERPITGVGPNNFYDYYKAYTVTSFKTWVSRNNERSTTHNYFLFMLVEQGYPAMILYGILIFTIFWYGQKVHKRCTTRFEKTIVLSALCLVAALFVNNFFSELLETDKIGSLFYLALAAIIAIDYKNASNKEHSHTTQ